MVILQVERSSGKCFLSSGKWDQFAGERGWREAAYYSQSRLWAGTTIHSCKCLRKSWKTKKQNIHDRQNQMCSIHACTCQMMLKTFWYNSCSSIGQERRNEEAIMCSHHLCISLSLLWDQLVPFLLLSSLYWTQSERENLTCAVKCCGSQIDE